MLLIQKLTLDLIPSKAPQIIYMDQYDSGRGIQIKITQNGDPCIIPTGTTVMLEAGTGKGQFRFPALSVNGDTVTIAIPKQLTDHAGTVLCGLSLENDKISCGTQNFQIEVQQSS